MKRSSAPRPPPLLDASLVREVPETSSTSTSPATRRRPRKTASHDNDAAAIEVPFTPSPVRVVSRPAASLPGADSMAAGKPSSTTKSSPLRSPAGLPSPPPNPKLHGGRVTRATIPDPLSPTGYHATLAVHFPDDDLLQEGSGIDDAKRVKLERDRKKKETEFWHNYIGPKTDLAVRQVQREETRLNRDRALPPPTDPAYRCILCTLPGGTCEHTPAWVKFAFESKLQDPVEVELKRLTDLEPPIECDLQPAPGSYSTISLATAGQTNGFHTPPDVISHFRRLQWMEPVLFINDRLNGVHVDLSTPGARGGHAAFLLDSKLFSFGGLCASSRRRSKQGPEGASSSCFVFHPYSSHHAPGTSQLDYGVVTNDMYTYSFIDCIWQKAITHGDLPEPRMGHVALAIDDRRAFVFGGRTGDGRCLNDAYLFHAREYRWERVAPNLPMPPPRYASSAALLADTGQVAVFGGRDHENAMGDLWVWDPHRRQWSSPLTVGVPPAARHGHVMVATSGGRVLVMGGCGVGPNAENKTDATTVRQDLQLRQAVKRVGEAYRQEEEEAKALGSAIARGAFKMDMQELHRAVGVATAAVVAREADTKRAEEHLVAIERERRLSEYWLNLNSSHAAADLDVVILSTEHGAFTWSMPTFPPISGCRPPARMNFTVEYVPRVDRVILWGGCEPTTTQVGVSNGAVYVLNLRSMRWSKPAVQECKEMIEPKLEAAKVSIRHAKRTVEAARGRAFSHGVPGGRSMELAQAEATLAVHEWRLGRLKEEYARFLPPPPPRYGHASVLYGGRIYQFGGWDGDVAMDELVVLDLEQPDERERRLRDEMAVRLERQRAKQEVQEAIELKRTWYMEICRRAAEDKREVAERKAMAFEDFLSSVPAKTRGPTPKVRWASAHTLYVEWHAVTKDALGLPMEPGSVEYILSLKGGFVPMYEGLDVLVEITVGNEQYEKPRLYKEGVVSRYPLAYATIKRDHHNGTFDVAYKNEGFEEKKVVRSRLRPAKEPEWEPVYRGTDTKAAIVDLVPEYIREKEPGYEVFCCLGIQTVGIDYPKGEPSLTGDVALCFTKNPVGSSKENGALRKIRRVMEIDSLILYAWDGNYWGDGIGYYYS